MINVKHKPKPDRTQNMTSAGGPHLLCTLEIHILQENTVMPVSFSQEVSKCIIVSHSKKLGQTLIDCPLFTYYYYTTIIIVVRFTIVYLYKSICTMLLSIFCIGSLEHDEPKCDRL